MSTLNQTQTTSFKAELYEGVHDLLTDTIMIALYTVNADLNAGTTVYTATEEVTGTGYVAGGVQMTGITIANVVFNAAVTARCALIYNASQGNKSIAVLDFGSDKTSANLTITMPANSATAALIRSSN